MGLHFESRLLAAISVAVLVVTALSLTIWNIADDASRTAQRVTHTHELLHLLARTRGYTLQIELATQGYRLNGELANLIERDQAIEAREVCLTLIRQRIADNPQQAQRWRGLRQVVDQRLAIARKIESLRRSAGAVAANTFVASAPLQATRERIYRLLAQMDQEERHQLIAREADYQHTRQLQVWLGSLIGVLLCLLLSGTYLLVRRQWRMILEHQRALADSEDNLAAMLRSIGDGVVATNETGHITRMNMAAETMMGWSLDAALEKPVTGLLVLIHAQTREPVALPLAAALATGTLQHSAGSIVLSRRGGGELPIAVSIAPICDRAGQIHGTVLVLRDVTAERQAEGLMIEQNALLARHVDKRTSQWHESEGHLRNVISSVPALIAYVNAELEYVYVNEQYRARFAPNRQDIAGCTVQAILGDERYALAGPRIRQVLAGEPQRYDWQPFPGVWQNIRYIPKLTPDKQIVGYYVLATDITEHKVAEEQINTLNLELAQRVHELEHVTRALRTLSAGNRAMLRANEESQLLDSMCHGIVLEGGYDMAVIWYCDQPPPSQIRPMAQWGFPGELTALLALQQGLTDHGLGQPSITLRAIQTGELQLGRNMRLDPDHTLWRDRSHPATSGLACPLMVEGQVIGALTIYDQEMNAFAPDEIILLTESSQDLAFGIATLRAQVERERARITMQHMMRYDPMTGLANAFEFEQALSPAIALCMEQGEPLALLQFNIERLSEINDAFGFRHGDQLLYDFGQRLQQSAPASALVARIRGDDFALLLSGYDGQAALTAVARIEHYLTRPFPVADIALEVSARVGIALFPQHGANAQDLLRCMDKAVHQAKKKSVSHLIYDPGQPQAEAIRLTMVAELRRAIDKGELRLYLQPKVAFINGAVCGAEALVRWQHPQRGLLLPASFIGLAEQTGLIRPLTEWVIKATLDQLQQWQTDNSVMPIAVNLSARNLHDEDLLNKILDWQTERNIRPGLLELELTETSIMEDAEFALALLYKIKESGIPLYIDDFGTGYSSLSYLQKLPVDYIKIDQSFVSDMPSNENSAMIVRSTIELVKNLGRKNVAEGVESAAHWQQLAALGCDYAQGYLIAKPMPAALFQTWATRFTPDWIE